MEKLQKVLEYLIIKIFIGKNANVIQYVLKFTKASSYYRVTTIFTDGLDEDFLLINILLKYYKSTFEYSYKLYNDIADIVIY